MNLLNKNSFRRFKKSIILSIYIFYFFTLYQISLLSHSEKGEIIPHWYDFPIFKNKFLFFSISFTSYILILILISYLSLVLFLLLNTYDIFFPFNVFQISIKQIFPSQTVLLICSKILQELLYCHKRKVLIKTRRQILNKN